MDTAAVVVIVVVMVVGLIGTVVPVMPGLILIWGAALAYGLIDGFGRAGSFAFTVISLLLAGGMVAGYVLPHRAGVRGGAARSSLRLGIVGAIVGFFVIPVLGLPIGAVAGVLLGEYSRLGDWGPAWTTTRRVIAGFGWAALAEFTAGVAMVGTWAAWLAVRR
ncbi:MAG: DUF456 family protein [Nitriliruptorales bacterium]|nr:DUF456 family protein [Nitriliruptorales bacterium]